MYTQLKQYLNVIQLRFILSSRGLLQDLECARLVAHLILRGLYLAANLAHHNPLKVRSATSRTMGKRRQVARTPKFLLKKAVVW